MRWRMFTRQLHWMSAAASLFCLCFYALTGLLLNNEGLWLHQQREVETVRVLGPEITGAIGRLKPEAPLPASLSEKLTATYGQSFSGATVRTDKGHTVIAIPRPGKRLLLMIMDAKGVLKATDKGPVAFFTDLHKGKNAPALWRLFIDLFAVCVLIFAVTGFILLCLQARTRKLTWPLLAGGLLLPVIWLMVILHT